MVKVCHFTSVHPPKDVRIFHKECKSLAKAGYDVSLIVAGASNESVDGVKIIGVPIKSSSRWKRIFETTKKVYHKALEIDADIYHFHDPELLPFGLKLKKKGKKVIFDSHEFVGLQILTKNYIPKFLRKPLSFVYRKIESFICSRLDAIVEVCTVDGIDYFKDIKTRRIFLNNSPIISNTPLRENKSGKKVVHIGSLTRERGITDLAYAIKKTDATLVLAGKFSSPQYQEEIESILGEQLEYKGCIPQEEVFNLLSECNIGISTLLNEGQYGTIDTLPTKIYEYMIAGLPIIMSDFPYLISFNNHNKIGICVDPANPTAIVKAINYIFSHPNEATEMGNKGKQIVNDTYNWQNESQKLLDLYSAL